MRSARLVLLLCLVALSAWGCASVPFIAAVDAMSVAEHAKTGFDMASGLNSRRRLDQQHDSGMIPNQPPAQSAADLGAEQAMLGLLSRQEGLLAQASANVFQGRAYIVGAYAGQAELERARRLAARLPSALPGVSSATLCLYPAGSGRAPVSDGELHDIIVRMAGVRTRDVRVRVVEGNAVLLGEVRGSAERDRLLASARTAGATSVQNHLRLLAAN